MWKANKTKGLYDLFSKRGNAISLDEEKMRSRLARGKRNLRFLRLGNGDGPVYAAVIILTLIFIRQVSGALAALS
jgi:hypothetical protein